MGDFFWTLSFSVMTSHLSLVLPLARRLMSEEEMANSPNLAFPFIRHQCTMGIGEVVYQWWKTEIPRLQELLMAFSLSTNLHKDETSV